MKNWTKVYIQSVKSLARNYHTWILLGLITLIVGFFTLGFPLILRGSYKSFFIPPASAHNAQPVLFFAAISSSIPTTFILLPFYSAMLGESNAKAAERTFLLSRPLSRDAYMFGKIMSTLTYTVGMAVVIWLMWCFIGIVSLAQGWTLFKPKQFNFAGLTFAIISLGIYGGVMGASLRYFLKERISSIIVMFSIIIVTTPILATTATSANPSLMILLLTSILPIAIYLPISCGCLYAGFSLMRKSNVGV